MGLKAELMCNVKSHISPITEDESFFYQTRITSSTVGLHHKKILNILIDLNISIGYDHILRILKDIVEAVSERIKDIPPQFIPGSPVYFAIDNCDFRNDTPDGKHDFHGTAQIVYQQSSSI